MADKNIIIRDPALDDLRIEIRHTGGQLSALVSYPAEPPDEVLLPADLTAAERAAGVTFLQGIRRAFRAKKGGYGA